MKKCHLGTKTSLLKFLFAQNDRPDLEVNVPGQKNKKCEKKNKKYETECLIFMEIQEELTLLLVQLYCIIEDTLTHICINLPINSKAVQSAPK